jgi:uncharacterized protein involved in exopolysaccharide biosynthesis
MNQDPTATNHEPAFRDEDEINLYELYLVIRRHFRFLAILFLGATFATGVVSKFVLTKTYQSHASLTPVESREMGLGAALGSLGGVIGIPIPGVKATPAQTFVAILQSRTVAEGVIERLGLMREFNEDEWDEARQAWKKPEEPPTMEGAVRGLKGISRISDDRKSGLVNIWVEYKDPGVSADIANAYLDELDRFLNVNALSLAKKKRVFLEGQLGKTRQELRLAEDAFKDFQEEKRFVAQSEQAEAAIKGMADLKAMIAAKEVELDVLRTYATPRNPKVQIVQSQLDEMRKQMERLEANHSKEGGSKLSLASAPELGLTYSRLKREVLFQEKVLELLTQQYELSRIEEVKEDVSFQVIDRAVPPVRKYKPKTLLNVFLAGVVSLMLGVFWVFFREYIRRARAEAQAKNSVS